MTYDCNISLVSKGKKERDKQIYMFEINKIFPGGRKSAEAFDAMKQRKNDNENNVLSIVYIVGSPHPNIFIYNHVPTSVQTPLYNNPLLIY